MSHAWWCALPFRFGEARLLSVHSGGNSHRSNRIGGREATESHTAGKFRRKFAEICRHATSPCTTDCSGSCIRFSWNVIREDCHYSTPSSYAHKSPPRKPQPSPSIPHLTPKPPTPASPPPTPPKAPPRSACGRLGRSRRGCRSRRRRRFRRRCRVGCGVGCRRG